MHDSNETANDCEPGATMTNGKTYTEDSGQFSFVSDGSHPAFNSHEFNRMLFDSPPSVLDSPCFDCLPNFRNPFPLLPTKCHSCTKEFGGLGGTTYSCNHRLCKDCASPISEGNQCPLCSGRPIMPHSNPQFPAQMFLSPMMTPRNIDDSFHNINQLSAGIQNISLSAHDFQDSFNIWEQPKSNSILFESLNNEEHPPVFSPTISDNMRGQHPSNLHLLPPMDPRTTALLLLNDIKEREKNVSEAAETVRRMIEGFEVGAQAVANEIRSVVHLHMTALEERKRELIQRLETVRATKLDPIKSQVEQPHMPRKEMFSYAKSSPTLDIRKGRNYADIQTSGELFSFGKEGSGDGELCRPWGICIDAHGRVLVADRSNNRIQIFDKDGDFLTKFGQGGSRPGQFDRPAGITTNSLNNIIVADKDNHRVQVFDENGGFLFKFGERGRPVGMFNYPWGVACNSLGHIAVSDTRNHRVQIFNAKGVFMRKCGFDTAYFYKDLDSPRGLCFLPDGQLLITDFNNHRLAVWSPRNGSDMKVYGTEGEMEGQFCRPQGITTDKNGHVLICDSRNNRIQVFSAEDMRCVAVFGENNGSTSGFQMPAELAVPTYQATGISVSPYLASPMGGPTAPVLNRAQLDRPTDIAVSPDGRVYVVDFGNNCIRVF